MRGARIRWKAGAFNGPFKGKNMTTAKQIKELGIVGAGGAGFPTYVKLGGEAEIFIVNAAECEPLLHKDKELLRHKTDIFFKGLLTCLDLTSARRCIIGIKAKYVDLISHLKNACPAPGRVEIMGLGDFYPVGDEITLIYETTGRIVSPGALPISRNVIVNNVETLYNIGLGTPLISKFITIGGDVKRPVSVEVPIGISYREVIALAEPNFQSAGPRDMETEFEVIVGGPMMGKLARSLDAPVTKTTGGLLLFPRHHPLVRRFKTVDEEKQVNRIGKAACDQCAICSALCPRHLLGHPIEPHRAMRSLVFAPIGPDAHAAPEVAGTSDALSPWNVPIEPHTMSCCECNLCTLVSCPEGLYPAQRCIAGKRRAMAAKAKFTGKTREEPHPLIDYRRTPVKKIMARLGLLQFQNRGELTSLPLHPEQLTIPLRQHIGAPAAPMVSVGDEVEKYQKIATVEEKLGAEIHSPVKGRVTGMDEKNIVIAPIV